MCDAVILFIAYQIRRRRLTNLGAKQGDNKDQNDAWMATLQSFGSNKAIK